MLKQFTAVLTLMISGAAFGQVGIGTETPQATLDIVGQPAETSILDGVIAPRITGEQLRAKTYTTDQTGALVYVILADTAPAGQTQDVTAEGYYYFNGSKWVIIRAGDMVNIYNSDGSLTGTGDRTLTLNGKELNFTGTNQRTSWRTDGVLYQENRQSSGGSGAIVIAGGSSSNLYLQQFRNGPAQIQAAFNSTSLDIGTNGSAVSAPLTISTSAGGDALATEKMRVTGGGNIGMNTAAPTEKLDVNGNTRLRDLPLNGATNAHHTTSGGGESPSKDQTFTATRTVVADANGVLGYVTGLPTSSNIYNTSGSLSSNRTLTFNTRTLEFLGSAQRTFWDATGAFTQQGLSSGTGLTNIAIIAPDKNSNGLTSNLLMQVFPESSASILAYNDVTALTIGTASSATGIDKPMYFQTAGGTSTGQVRMTLTGTGSLGLSTSTPTEKFHTIGNVRLQGLPLNGAINAIFTTSGGTASATQNQTFTATRTLVSDANGVLGYISGLPSTTAPTGFERLPSMTATDFYWKLIGAPTANYGTAGKYSVDASWNPTNLSETIAGIPYSAILSYSGLSLSDMGARGQNSFAAGTMNSASGAASATFGGGNQASATGTFAAGILNKATGDNSIAMGQSSQATGSSAIALGNTGLASGENSLAIGQANQATAQSALALGNTNKATAISSIAMGQANEANGQSSIAIGNTNIANGQSSVAIGHRLTTSVQYSTAMGLFNKVHTVSAPAERLFVLGNGTGDSDAQRSDAFTVLKNGKVGVDIDNFETTTSNAKLEVNGQIRVRPETTTVTCNTANEGSIRYFTVDTNNGEFRGCKKTAGAFAWVTL